MKISIIIPVFNVENYLSKMLNSILSQQIEEFEIILIDDGSTDSSGKLCDIYSEKYDNICVIHQSNKGVSSARNVGIGLAKGDYLFFIDADDEVKDSYFANMVKLLETTDSDMVCCSYSSHKKKDKREQFYTLERPQKMMYGLIRRLINERKEKKYNGYLWCKVFKRNVIYDNDIFFDKNVRIWEDTLFIENYLCYCRQIAFLNDDLYFYRARDGSVTRSNLRKNQELQSIAIVWGKIALLNKAPLRVRIRAGYHYLRALLIKFKKVILK